MLDIWGLAVRVRALQAVRTGAASKDKEGLRATTGIWSHPQASAQCIWLAPKVAITAAATKKTGPGTVLSAAHTRPLVHPPCQPHEVATDICPICS